MTSKGQSAAPGKRIRSNDDVIFEVPYLGELTYNEVHAATIGAGAGLAQAMAWTAGRPKLAAGLAVVLASYAVLGHPLGRSRSKGSPKLSIGLRTIKHEPWYFLALMMAVFSGAIIV